MAFIPYHSITYNSGLFHNGVTAGEDIELIAPGTNVNQIKSIVITNTHDTTAATFSLFIEDDPTAAVAKIYYIIKKVIIPIGTSLVLDNSSIISFDNSIYGLYARVAGSDTLDVMINI